MKKDTVKTNLRVGDIIKHITGGPKFIISEVTQPKREWVFLYYYYPARIKIERMTKKGILKILYSYGDNLDIIFKKIK